MFLKSNADLINVTKLGCISINAPDVVLSVTLFVQDVVKHLILNNPDLLDIRNVIRYNDALSVDESMQCFYQDDDTLLGNRNDIIRTM